MSERVCAFVAGGACNAFGEMGGWLLLRQRAGASMAEGVLCYSVRNFPATRQSFTAHSTRNEARGARARGQSRGRRASESRTAACSKGVQRGEVNSGGHHVDEGGRHGRCAGGGVLQGVARRLGDDAREPLRDVASDAAAAATVATVPCGERRVEGRADACLQFPRPLRSSSSSSRRSSSSSSSSSYISDSGADRASTGNASHSQ